MIDVLRVVLFQDELHEVAATAVADEGDSAPVLPFEIADPAAINLLFLSTAFTMFSHCEKRSFSSWDI